MFSSYDKAIAALVTPILSILILSGVLPEDLATEEIIAGITGAVTGIVAWLIPNKEKEVK